MVTKRKFFIIFFVNTSYFLYCVCASAYVIPRCTDHSLVFFANSEKARINPRHGWFAEAGRFVGCDPAVGLLDDFAVLLSIRRVK
jgi:hypothetical protein